jgi:hypothetical protein
MNVKYDNSNDQYPEFSRKVKERFSTLGHKHLFLTDVTGLEEAFLGGMPEEARPHYNCRSCLNFIRNFGGLVTISDTGELVSALWEDKDVPPFFEESVKAMKRLVLTAKVTGIFKSSVANLGQANTNGWDHLSVSLPRTSLFNHRLRNSGQEMARLKSEFNTLMNGLLEFTPEQVNTAVTVLETGGFNRADKVYGPAKFLQKLHEDRSNAVDSKHRNSLTWFAVAEAPDGYCHVKSTMIGTLLEDIAKGLTFEKVKSNFEHKMRSENYQRAQTPPSVGNREQAERIVANAGIAGSLRRRYPSFEEVPNMLWRAREVKTAPVSVPAQGGVFDHVPVKGETDNASTGAQMNIPATVMTWDKFMRTIMPGAESIEVLTDKTERVMSLVKAADTDAPNIVQWPNGYTWYYPTGTDGEIKNRVEGAGGTYENTEIRCSLIWDGHTDLDLHCKTSEGHINWNNKMVGSGWLDIDMNGIDGMHDHPVENIRWMQGEAPIGNINFYLHNYTERGNGRTPYKAELVVNGQVFVKEGVIGGSGSTQPLFSFNYVKGQVPRIEGAVAAVKLDDWGIAANTFVKVKGITESPNMWDEPKVVQSGHHIFFLLEGCKDMSGNGLGFLTEMLKSDYREIRKTLEGYIANTPIEGVEEASAAGVGYSKDKPWDLTLKVKTGGSTRMIKIDRWD